MSEQNVRITGRILYLTEDAELLARQLGGGSIDDGAKQKLIDNISTDELTPGWVCYYYDETLGALLPGRAARRRHRERLDQERWLWRDRQRPQQGLRLVARDGALTASSRPGSAAGRRREHREDLPPECQNIGLLTSTDFSLIDRIERGEAIPI
jgi:3-isopropylmalate/(R)-2-methylmalate dehydratase large subunit